MTAHWQPKDRKEDMAQDIREFVQRDDPAAEMNSLQSMKAHDLVPLMLALRAAESRDKASRTLFAALKVAQKLAASGPAPAPANDPRWVQIADAIAAAEAAGITAE